ncbi:hypothetical protein M758_4G000800 [Ceratodon purpureus]|nr:hypothetical protein M758_4G000800 [Ceratodon purpureus]
MWRGLGAVEQSRAGALALAIQNELWWNCVFLECLGDQHLGTPFHSLHLKDSLPRHRLPPRPLPSPPLDPPLPSTLPSPRPRHLHRHLHHISIRIRVSSLSGIAIAPSGEG